MDCIVFGKSRKSGELIPAGASKRANCTSDDTRNKAISKKVSQRHQPSSQLELDYFRIWILIRGFVAMQISQVKEAAASKIANKLRMKRLSVAKRLSIVRAGSRVTNPRPFRLRTQVSFLL
jgi:hypothetical protein